MADSVLWQLLTDSQTGLRTDLSFVAQGTDPAQTIASAAIQIQKHPVQSQVGTDKDRLRFELTPGLIISPPKIVHRPITEGTNLRDDVYYPILIQLIDKDNQERLTNLRTYTKWLEQIAKYFHNQGRANVLTTDGQVNIAGASQTFVVDRKMWFRERLFVGGVIVNFKSREPRGITT